MNNLRLIARLDIKGPNLIKGIHLEGLRVMGDPQAFARHYYDSGIDELLYIDSVASLYGRNNLRDIIKNTAQDVYVPMTVGGGIRSIDDVREILRSGADKVAINTAAVRNPELITQVAQRFGSQCMVLGVEAKRIPTGWEAYTDAGRERTGVDVVEWCEKACALGAGEILLTSVDQEGTCKGFDLELLQAVGRRVDVPIIASGGAGSTADVVSAAKAGANGVAVAHLLHYRKLNVAALRLAALDAGFSVRTDVPLV